jgi:hypothetical protein
MHLRVFWFSALFFEFAFIFVSDISLSQKMDFGNFSTYFSPPPGEVFNFAYVTALSFLSTTFNTSFHIRCHRLDRCQRLSQRNNDRRSNQLQQNKSRSVFDKKNIFWT